MHTVRIRARTAPVVLAWCLASTGYAQPTTAGIAGVVRDGLGGAIASARVGLSNPSTGVVTELTTGEDGGYQFLGLPPASYRLEVASAGFAGLKRDGILLRVGDRLIIDLELTVGDARQTMEVNTNSPLLAAGSGTVSLVVEQKNVVTLPLDGRNFVPLIALSPGVNLPPGSLLPRINGSRPRVSEYIYDGISVLQPEPGQVAYYPVIDAINEFRVETNAYSAEYGRSNGGVILVSQKSGTNELRGTWFEFFRNEKLNARNALASGGPRPRFRRNQYGFVLGGPIQKSKTFFFVDWQGTRLSTGVNRISTVPTSAQRGGAFSTAVFDPATTGRNQTGYVRAAFPGGIIPLSRFDGAATAYRERYPLPNVRTASGAEAAVNNYQRLGNDSTAADQFDTRLDRYLGSRHRVFVRYSFLRDDSRPATPLPDGSGALTTGVLANTVTRADSLAAEHSWTLGPRAIQQLRFGYTRRAFERDAMRTGQAASQISGIPNIPASSFSDVPPALDIVGWQQLGPPAGANGRFRTSVTQLVQNLAWVRSKHSLKAGLDVRRETLDVLQPPSPTGNFQFTSIFTAGLSPAGAVVAGTGNSFASFLLGQVGRFSLDVQPAPLKPRAAIGEFFIQDDWRATRRLTLNAGVRYTLNLPSTVVANQGAVFNLRTQELDLLGANGFPRSARQLETRNFAPRVGLAYRLADSLAVRAGYGMTWIEQAGITTPFTTPLFPFIQSLGQQSLDNLNPAFVLSRGPSVSVQPPGPGAGLGQGVFGVQRDNGSGYAQQWNLTLQKTFGGHWSVEAGYLASKLTRLGVPDVNLNQLTVEQLALGPALTESVANPFFGQIPVSSSLGGASIARGQLLRPYPRFTSVALYRNNVGHSTYHSGQARVEKRFSGGLTFSGAYTFSRLIDDAGAVFDSAVLSGPVTNFQSADSFNRRLEKDRSTGNVPHIFSSGMVYELPFGRSGAGSRSGWRYWVAGGWQVASLLRLQSGSPLAVTQATNLNAFAGFGIQRPNRAADPTLPPEARTTARWFNTSAFTQAPQFALGNSSRNPVTGPGYRTADVMVSKTLPVGERWRAEFRAEAFNATNTPPLGNPNATFGNLAFGTITTALDPRVFEFVLKLHF